MLPALAYLQVPHPRVAGAVASREGRAPSTGRRCSAAPRAMAAGRRPGAAPKVETQPRLCCTTVPVTCVTQTISALPGAEDQARWRGLSRCGQTRQVVWIWIEVSVVMSTRSHHAAAVSSSCCDHTVFYEAAQNSWRAEALSSTLSW